MFRAAFIASTLVVVISQPPDQQRHVRYVDRDSGEAQQHSEPLFIPPATNHATDGGQPSREPRDENIEIQRDIAASTQRLAQDTHRYADYTLALVVVGLIIGGFQVFLLFGQSRSTAKAADAAKASADAALLGQRAYVRMSHRNPGIRFTGDRTCEFEIETKNAGSTPAEITKWVCRPHISDQPLPDVPPYGEPEAPGESFLLGGDHFFTPVKFEFKTAEAATEVREETAPVRVWMLGFIEYKDQFGRRHRSGYARAYNREYTVGRGNNLAIVNKPGYNYDIEIDEQGNPKPQTQG